MAKIDDVLREARALREVLRNRLAAVEKSITGFERLRREVPPDVLEQVLEQRDAVALDELQPPLVGVPDEPLSPAEIVPLARNELLIAQRPMKRGALVRAIEARNAVVLPGKDKNKNLGTILWRHPRDFITVEGEGYWVKGVALEGVYEPERDDEPLPMSEPKPLKAD